MSASRFLAYGAGGAVAVGLTGYYGLHLREVAKLESEVSSVKRLLDNEAKNLTTLKKSITEHEQLMKALQSQEEEQKKEVASAKTSVQAARKHLAAMEAAFLGAQQGVLQLAHDSLTAITTLDKLKVDRVVIRQAIEDTQKKLISAQREANESRKLLNPLNHPSVKALLGQK